MGYRASMVSVSSGSRWPHMKLAPTNSTRLTATPVANPVQNIVGG